MQNVGVELNGSPLDDHEDDVVLLKKEKKGQLMLSLIGV